MSDGEIKLTKNFIHNPWKWYPLGVDPDAYERGLQAFADHLRAHRELMERADALRYYRHDHIAPPGWLITRRWVQDGVTLREELDAVRDPAVVQAMGRGVRECVAKIAPGVKVTVGTVTVQDDPTPDILQGGKP